MYQARVVAGEFSDFLCRDSGGTYGLCDDVEGSQGVPHGNRGASVPVEAPGSEVERNLGGTRELVKWGTPLHLCQDRQVLGGIAPCDCAAVSAT